MKLKKSLSVSSSTSYCDGALTSRCWIRSSRATIYNYNLNHKKEPSKTAFVFIEFQNEFVHEGGKLYEPCKASLEKYGTLANGAKLLKKARDTNCLVVHCPILFEKGHNEIGPNPYGILKGVKDGEAFMSGTFGSKICAEMEPSDDEIIVKGKKLWNF